MRMHALTALVAVLALATGCSLVLDPDRHRSAGDSGVMDSATVDTAPDAPPPMLAPGNVCPSLARVLCEGRARCCTTLPTPDDCQTTVRESCEDYIGPVILEPNAMYDPVRGAELLAIGQASADGCTDDILGLLANRSGIFSAFRGTWDDGEPCTTVTTELIPAAIARNFVCTDGNGCKDEGPAGFVCRALSPINGECVAHLDCADQLYCSGLNRCADRLPDVTACTRPLECQSLFCNGQCADPNMEEVWCTDPFEVFSRVDG